MARMVRHTHTGPYKLEPQPKPVWICMCGLSRNLPFCDSSHKQCVTEQPDKLYEYDLERIEATTTRLESPASDVVDRPPEPPRGE